MGSSESVLPEGPAAKALQEMTKPKRIAITDSFWFELLKVQLPGMMKPGFFEAHYSEPTVLDALVRDAYFLQLVATNEHSANFRTFLRFWARLLHYFRTSPSDAKPCSFSAVLSLSLLCRCLLKQFAECFPAHELLFQLEQVPLHEEEGEAAKCKEGHILVNYGGKHLEVKWPPEADVSSLFIEPLCSVCPEDATALRDSMCTIRALPTGEHFSVVEAMERLQEIDVQEVVLCPSAVPHARGSVLRSVFREIVDFLLYSTFGAVNSTSPSLHGDSEAESGVPRNLSMSPTTMRLQAILHEILLLLAAVVAVKQPSSEEESGWKSHRNCAPFQALFDERRLAEAAFRLRAEAAEAAGQRLSSKEVKAELEPKMLSASEPLSLPFLQAFAEVLQESSDDKVSENANDADGTANAVSHVKNFDGLTAKAFLATLLNSLWLEPHAALLPNPPKEVLDLLNTRRSSDVEASAYRGIEVSKLYLASSELMPGLPSGFVGDDGAAVEAGMAGKAVSKRALVVLLLLLFYNPQANGKIRVAFASLTDPRVDASAATYTTITAPLHFPKILRVILQKLLEPGYPLLLYCLVIKNASFRKYCQRNADKVLPALLEVLNSVSTTENKILAKAPAGVMAMLLVILALTGDAGFCEQMSDVKLLDARSVLGASQRSVREISLSSLLIVVILRLAHWNFGACRDSFFNRTVAGILGNLAAHGVEHVHWHTANRMLEVAGLLARNAVKLRTSGAPPSRPPSLGEAAEMHRSRMVRSLLTSLLRLVSSCLRMPRVSTNTHLVYALQKNYPSQFTQLEADPDLGPPLMHVRTATDWFEAQCPATDDTDLDVDAQINRLEEASARLPAELMTLASVAGASVSAYAETEAASAYFLPAVWEAAQSKLPDHVCWSSSSTKA